MVLFHISYWLIRSDLVHFVAQQIQTCLTTSQASLSAIFKPLWKNGLAAGHKEGFVCVCKRERVSKSEPGSQEKNFKH